MKYFLKSIAIIVIIFSSSQIYAQDGRVNGTVFDNEFSEPLAFTNIQVRGTGITASTNFEGTYALDLKPGRYTLVFSFAGYDSTVVEDIVVDPGSDVELDVTLSVRSLRTEANTSSANRNNE